MSDDSERHRFTRRALLLGAGQAGVLGLLGMRLHDLQVADGARLAQKAVDNRVDTQLLLPHRGRILDRSGRPLAVNEEIPRAVVLPRLTGDLKRTLDELSRVVAIGPLARDKILRLASRQSAGLPIVVASGLSFEQVAEIELLAPLVSGIRTEKAVRRRYNFGNSMGHIVGYVGAHDRAAIDDEAVLRMADMRVGKTGVERAMEERLRGRAGTLAIEVDARGRFRRELSRQAPETGGDVTLTVDVELQRRVVERLSRERRGAVVALDVTTGEVVALASVPEFDPADMVNGLTNQTWKRLLSAANRPMLNRATAGLYPPGSTFKIVTALAALEAGLISPTEHIECNGRFELAGQTFRCWDRHGHGSNNLHRALAQSCDVFFYEAARRTGIEAIAAMARKLGLGDTLPIEIANQKQGLVPTPDWKLGQMSRSWFAGETILAAIGQGYVQATPLQLAVMTARVATGRMVQPSIVMPSDGAGRAVFEPLAVDIRWLDVVRRGMAGVVNEEGGTGTNARIDARGFRVAGKTGTSQVHRASTDRRSDELEWEQRDHALFVGYVPADKPRFAVAAVIEHGGGGGAAAAPLVRDVIQILIDSAHLERAEGQDGASSGEGRRRAGRRAG